MKPLPLRLIAIAVVSVILIYQCWLWMFCRFYVPANHMAIITAKTGKPLPPGNILAEKGEKGVLKDVLSEGRHFLNPVTYDVEIRPVFYIPLGKIGIVTSKQGTDLPQGQFLAEKGEKGIWKDVLGPGKYRLNPQGYNIEIVDAKTIPIGFTGVVTSLSGEQSKADQFATRNQKGVMEDILQPGLYYTNPKALKIDIVEIGLNQVSLLGAQGSQVIAKSRLASQNVALASLESTVFQEQRQKRADYYANESKTSDDKASFAPQAMKTMAGKKEKQMAERKASMGQMKATNSSSVMELANGVQFPSRDGFDIYLDMTVEFEFLPSLISKIYRNYGDLPAVVDKIIMPQIQSVSRLKGSAYRAIDFIVGEGREKFQNDLRATLEMTLKERSIVAHNALISHVSVPFEILDPIRRTSVAKERDLTNKEKQNTAKKLAELNTEVGLIEQRRKQVSEETEKLKAEIYAVTQREVGNIAANTKKEVFAIRKETAVIKANTARKLGEARAEVTQLVEGEKANAFALKVKAINDAESFSLFEFAKSLNPEVSIRILHSGEGTLWTDLKNPTLAELGSSKALARPKHD